MFEQPPCPDGHGEECPERACTECGTAMLVDTAVLIDTTVPVDPARTVATAGPVETASPGGAPPSPAHIQSTHNRPSRGGSTRAVA